MARPGDSLNCRSRHECSEPQDCHPKGGLTPISSMRIHTGSPAIGGGHQVSKGIIDLRKRNFLILKHFLLTCISRLVIRPQIEDFSIPFRWV